MSGVTAIAIKGVTLRTRDVKGEKRVELVVHTCDGEAWIAISDPMVCVADGNMDTHVTANGITALPSRRCPVIGRVAMRKMEDAEIAAGNMKPRSQWGTTELKKHGATVITRKKQRRKS